MSKFKSSEEKLNRYVVPSDFHDMSIINMHFLNDTIRIRFTLAKYMDEFDILEDDKHFAIIDVLYTGIKIHKMNMEGLIDFRSSSVLSLEEENGIISLNIQNDIFDFCFYIEFSCINYKWKVLDIIKIDEYFKYTDALTNVVDGLIKLEKIEVPNWSKFKD